MTDLEKLARQYVAENQLTLGEKLALSVFVMRAKQVLEAQAPSNVEQLYVVDEERGWKLA
jgi:hypothetical protein